MKSIRIVKETVAVKRYFYMSLTLGLLIIVGMALVPFVQTSTGYGQLIAYAPNQRLQEIGAPVDGRVAKWFVREGAHVKKGVPLVEIRDIDPNILQKIEREYQSARSRKNAAEMVVKTSTINVERQRSLADDGLTSERAFEQAKIELNRHQADLEAAKAELARIELRLDRQGFQVVNAPHNGTLLRVIAPESGPVLKAGAPVALFVPDADQRAVELFVSGNDVPLIQPGQEVRLQFEGWPAVQFSGWPSIAVGTFQGTVGFVDAADSGKGKFRVVIFPSKDTRLASQQKERLDSGQSLSEDYWPSQKFLRQGARVSGWILLGQVSIGYELWRRFNGFPANLEKPPAPEVDDGSSAKDKQKKS